MIHPILTFFSLSSRLIIGFVVSVIREKINFSIDRRFDKIGNCVGVMKCIAQGLMEMEEMGIRDGEVWVFIKEVC